MHKIAGSVIIMLVSVYIGVKKYREFYERKRLLILIRDGSEKIRNNLRCMCMPLYECFLSGGDFFVSAAGEMKGNTLPAEAVKKAAGKLNVLKKADREIIDRFAGGLCAQDCQGQLSNIDLFIRELDAGIRDAEQELSTRGQLFVKGSILSGAAVILLLI